MGRRNEEGRDRTKVAHECAWGIRFFLPRRVDRRSRSLPILFRANPTMQKETASARCRWARLLLDCAGSTDHPAGIAQQRLGFSNRENEIRDDFLHLLNRGDKFAPLQARSGASDSG